MKPPAQIKPWMSLEEMAVWVREAPTKESYQKRLVIWLTHIYSHHAHRIAGMLQVSKQAVWLWIGQYNKKGPEGLDRKGRGGRRWAFLPWSKEESLLQSLEEEAARGEILTAKHLRPKIEETVGKEVTMAYVYRLLHRHKWRKIVPRPRHVKADREAQETFKKTSRKSVENSSCQRSIKRYSPRTAHPCSVSGRESVRAHQRPATVLESSALQTRSGATGRQRVRLHPWCRQSKRWRTLFPHHALGRHGNHVHIPRSYSEGI